MGRRATDPNFFIAGHPAPMCGDFCPLRPAASGARFGLRHLRPLKRSEPRTGHIAGRAGYSAPSPWSTRAGHRRARVKTRRRLQGPPETRVPMLTPQAPLPARDLRHGNRTTPKVGGNGWVHRIVVCPCQGLFSEPSTDDVFAAMIQRVMAGLGPAIHAANVTSLRGAQRRSNPGANSAIIEAFAPGLLRFARNDVCYFPQALSGYSLSSIERCSRGGERLWRL